MGWFYLFRRFSLADPHSKQKVGWLVNRLCDWLVSFVRRFLLAGRLVN